MRNFNPLDGRAIQLPSGVFAGVESYGCYQSGELAGVRLSERNMLVTHAGELVPAYTENYRRKNKYSVEFYKNGMVKAAYLDEQQEIMTPIGEFPAELVTFFDTGELRRFFPLDGKISGFWSEKDERSLAVPFSFELPFASFSAIISSVCFYRGGDIRSVTLFPGETVTVSTECGAISARRGFSLHETGELQSLEPSRPVEIRTPVGAITAFDPNAVCLNADSNSLAFAKDGRATALTTVHSRVEARAKDGRLLAFSPREVVNPLNGESLVTEGLRIAFDYEAGTATFGDACGQTVLLIGEHDFAVAKYSGAGPQ
ncbi:MAG: hypothetical protein LBG71_07380 [Clostridiales Family XIII bacterium]|jgi:hypothetical protein|nr:hypothetical protein [Clostridiales Family XIII bacterium]